jgi:hypothetical protein
MYLLPNNEIFLLLQLGKYLSKVHTTNSNMLLLSFLNSTNHSLVIICVGKLNSIIQLLSNFATTSYQLHYPSSSI